AVVSGQAGHDSVGRTECLRRLHDGPGHRARRHKVSGLVGGTYPVASFQLPVASSKSRGFTLIEVLIVITLVTILASVGLATYTNSVRRSREATLKEDLFRMRDAMDQYYADKNKWPA